MNLRFLSFLCVLLQGTIPPSNAGVLVPARIDKITPATGMGFGADVSVDATTAAITMQGAPGLNTSAF